MIRTNALSVHVQILIIYNVLILLSFFSYHWLLFIKSTEIRNHTRSFFKFNWIFQVIKVSVYCCVKFTSLLTCLILKPNGSGLRSWRWAWWRWTVIKGIRKNSIRLYTGYWFRMPTCIPKRGLCNIWLIKQLTVSYQDIFFGDTKCTRKVHIALNIVCLYLVAALVLTYIVTENLPYLSHFYV